MIGSMQKADAVFSPDLPGPSSTEDSCLGDLAAGNFSRECLAAALALRGDEQEELFALARARRSAGFPAEEVEARSVIELSNVCQQSCNYCSMFKEGDLKRYVIKQDDVLEMVEFLYAKGRRVFLLQSGENTSKAFVNYVSRCVSGIKNKHPDSEVILCLGNLSREQYVHLKEAGADRYILKFESSSPELYQRWKPSDTLDERLACLDNLIDVGFKVGTGNMVGLPGQTVDSVVDDILLVHRLEVSMMSSTVFIPNEGCNYRDESMGDVDTVFNMMALMRIMNPDRLMPTTSCLDKARQDGQLIGLCAGANTVTIHDGTPENFKKLFPIYSSARCTPGEERMLGLVAKANLGLGLGSLI